MLNHPQNSAFHLTLLWLLCMFVVTATAQAQEETEYDQEYNYGVNFNTHGGLIGGFAFKYSRAKGTKSYHHFGFQLVNIKPAKELRAQSLLTNNTFKLFKTHYLFSFRPHYGQEWVLFKKSADEGIQINAIAAAGPSIGITKPYYVLYSENFGDPNAAMSIPYDPSLDDQKIQGFGNFSDGFNQLKFHGGAHAKTSLSFEYGRTKQSVFGIEAGFLHEYFFSPIQILAYAPKYNYFPTAFLTVYYGVKY